MLLAAFGGFAMARRASPGGRPPGTPRCGAARRPRSGRPVCSPAASSQYWF